ncbi:MAG: type II toxin-antitoxin system VapC family toxin [Acidobacteriota bacterium]
MDYLCDTNIFLRLALRNDPDRSLVFDALQKLILRSDRLFYTSQILGEFWNVCTRPTSARSGLGLSIEQTERKVRLIERHFRLLPDSVAVHQEWRRIIPAYGVSGVQVHDARLVAAMQVHGLQNIITLNLKDFARYSGINAIHPKDVK